MVAMVLNPEIEVQIRREALGELSMLEEARLLVIVPTLLHAPEPVELRSAAVGTLGRLGVEAEGVALDALGDTDVDVRQAAVYALGTIGTARSVPALRALNGPTELERAAKDAVLAIQDRIGVEGGGLALAVDGGGLAVVEAEES
jgi:HEAT repeat protein